VLVVGWGVRLALHRMIDSAVDHRFALRLESHKHQLQLIAEEERFDLQRRLAGASLYLQKQHAAVAEIYSAVRIAHGAVSKLFGLQRGFDLSDCNADDLREILSSAEVLKGKQDELLHAWREDRRAGAEAITLYLVDLTLPRAERKLQEAQNTMYLNELYLSDPAIRALDAFVAECDTWILRRQFPPQRGEPRESISRERLDQSLEQVQVTLRAALADPPRREAAALEDPQNSARVAITPPAPLPSTRPR
jgi:hypothetical protein